MHNLGRISDPNILCSPTREICTLRTIRVVSIAHYIIIIESVQYFKQRSRLIPRTYSLIIIFHVHIKLIKWYGIYIWIHITCTYFLTVIKFKCDSKIKLKYNYSNHLCMFCFKREIRFSCIQTYNSPSAFVSATN